MGEALKEVRRRHPTAILIGNSAYDWQGLNGEMIEHNERDFAKEFQPFNGHKKPDINRGLIKLTQETKNDDCVRRKLTDTGRLREFFAAAVSYQYVPWFPIYEEVLVIVAQEESC